MRETKIVRNHYETPLEVVKATRGRSTTYLSRLSLKDLDSIFFLSSTFTFALSDT